MPRIFTLALTTMAGILAVVALTSRDPAPWAMLAILALSLAMATAPAVDD